MQAHDSAGKQEEVTAWEAERQESKYARELLQLPATRQVCFCLGARSFEICWQHNHSVADRCCMPRLWWTRQ